MPALEPGRPLATTQNPALLRAARAIAVGPTAAGPTIAPMRPHATLRHLRRAGLIFVALLAVILIVVKLRYGRGEPYPDVNTPPLVPTHDVAVAAELDFPPGNVAGSADGRVFVNLHPFALPARFTDVTLFELASGTLRPYPDLASQKDLAFVFGMTVDRQNRLWLTCPATLDRSRTRVIAYDLGSNTRVVDHELEPGVARFGQDLRVTPDGKTLVFADTGAFRFTAASLVVVDVESWASRQILTDDRSTRPEDRLIRTRGEPYRIGHGLLTFQVGVDGIAISDDGEWLFFAAMSHDTLHRVRLRDVLDPTLSPGDLAARVDAIGKKPLSDGIAAAPDGSVLVTDVEHGSIVRIDPRPHPQQGGELRTLARLDQVVWADGVHVAPSGDVYFTDSAIPAYIDPLLRPPSLERLRAGRPYRLYRFSLPRR